MSLVLTLLIVALGGALGALCRYAMGELARAWTRLPGWVAILAANLLGCLILGAGFVWFDFQERPLRAGSGSLEDLELLRSMLLTGFCGSITTFSSFSLDTLMLWYEGRPGAAAFNWLGSTTLGLATIYGALALEAVL